MRCAKCEKELHDCQCLWVKTYSGGKPNYTQPIEQEPVAWWHDRGDAVDLNVSGHGTPLYFAPPKKEWVGLTLEDVMEITGVTSADSDWNVTIAHKWIRAIEDKLREKNG